MFPIRIALALLLAASPVAPALAGPQGKDDGGQASGNSKKAASPSKPDEDVDTEHLFGFTEGTDAGEKGQQEVVFDSVSRIGKRRSGPGPSHYRAFDARLGYQFDPIDRLSIELSAFGTLHRVRTIADLDDKAFGTFDGVSVDVKYQFLKGSAEQPVGFALEVRPRFSRILPLDGRGADIFDIETLAQVDVQIVPNKLWYGSNVSFEPAVGRQRGSGEGYRSSTLVWSNVLVGEVADKTYLGPELRYLRGYDGAFLNRLESEAVTLGPALHHRFTEKVWVTLAYAGQIWGRDTDPAFARRALGLGQFERHAVRLKLGMEF
ncbi:hypothetical protein [Methylobacterium sp. 77]|uniref:hypothetical protein n=1 Tax=Methylobacterium sp. 77 TaxID=1101192 RepID=UPI000373736F|nr:hypothetical protein [Methylobacterium sp. 77]